MAKLSLSSFGSLFSSWQALNSNNTAIVAAVEKTLSRDGTAPNQMAALLDMNSNPIINVPDATSLHGAVNLEQVTALVAAAGGTPTSTVLANLTNYAALRAYPVTGLTNGALFYVQGFATLKDGGEGFFMHTTSAVTENFGTNIVSNTAGHYYKRIFQGPIHDVWFGVVGDGVTDNSVALQRVEDQAAALGINAIYFPPTPMARCFNTTINLSPGVKHYGCGADLSVPLGGAFNSGKCNLYFTSPTSASTGVYAFQLLRAIGAQSCEAPQFFDLNITTNFGSGIRLNSRSGGFTDDNTSQGAMNNFRMERVVACTSQRGTTFMNLNKLLDCQIKQINKVSFDYGIDMGGCDNITIRDSHFNSGLICEIFAQAFGTFGNDLWIRDNILTSPFTGALGHLVLGYRSFFITGNYFEAQSSLDAGGAAITLNGFGNGVITDNQMDCNVAQCPTWLRVTTSGGFFTLRLENNFTTGGNVAPVIWPGGVTAYATTIFPTVITGGNNVAQNAGIPFFTQTRQPRPWQPPISGSNYWEISPETPCVTNTDPYYTSLMISTTGEYDIPPNAGGSPAGNRIDLNGGTNSPTSITDNVDVWVLARGGVNAQVLNITIGGSSTNQALTTSLAWYKVASNVAVAGITSMKLSNTDTTRNSHCFVRQVLVKKT